MDFYYSKYKIYKEKYLKLKLKLKYNNFNQFGNQKNKEIENNCDKKN